MPRWQLRYYDLPDMKAIVKRSALLIGVPIDEDGATEIAKRSRGTPRIANRLLRRVRDFATVERDGMVDGEIYAMTSGSADHSALALEVLYALRGAIGSRPCRVHTSDLRLYVEAAGLATFPDGMVICGPMQQHGPSPHSTALNPTVLLEVTSDSSEDYDTGAKLEYYRSIPSLRDYIIVSHRERRITVHSRNDGAGWMARVAIAGGRVAVEALCVELVVDDIYRGSGVR